MEKDGEDYIFKQQNLIVPKPPRKNNIKEVNIYMCITGHFSMTYLDEPHEVSDDLVLDKAQEVEYEKMEVHATVYRCHCTCSYKDSEKVSVPFDF